MTLRDLLDRLPPTGLDGLAFPRGLLGAFRRKSISFSNGLTDETSIVFWFQSKSFTIDLRLPDGAATALVDRQGWVGDTLWDEDRQHMSWRIARSYQPRDQWPEPASLRFIGNSVIEFAPSGAYVEDWRQQCVRGPLLGLRLISLRDGDDSPAQPMAGGLILAGDHAAYAKSRRPGLDEALRSAASLEQALANGIATEQQIESYDVSVALQGGRINHSTQPERLGQDIFSGDWAVQPDGVIALTRTVDGRTCHLRFVLDIHEPDFRFIRETPVTPAASQWMEDQKQHLFRHAIVAR